MRIALINASVGFSDRRKSIPIGLAYIIAYLRHYGVASDGYDFGDSLVAPETLVARHGLDAYDVVGISVYNESFHAAVRMARAIKRVRPDAAIVLGGPQATAMHDTIVASHPEIDFVVRREGELPMHELVGCLRSNGSLEQVPSLTWRDGEGQTRVNPDAVPVADLDQLPFPAAEFVSEEPYAPLSFFDVRENSVREAIAINTSRSCPYNCSFCGVLTIGRKYRVRTPESVVDELRFFRERDGRDYRHVYFSDANFFVQHRRSLAIAQALHEFDPTITFSFGTRVNQILRARETIEAMVPIGLRFIEVGVESASPSVLSRLAKNVAPEVNVAATQLLNRLGVEIALDFIMVDPASTVDDLALNLDFLEQNGFLDYYPHEHLYTHLVLYEGTPIRTFYEERQGRTFETGSLPDTRDLFERPEIVHYWDVSREMLRTHQQRIDDVLGRVERVLLRDEVRRTLAERGPQFEPAALMQLDVTSLRHAPTIVFRRLVDTLRADVSARPTLEELTAAGFGSPPVSLAELIDRVEARGREVCELLEIEERDLAGQDMLAGALQ